MNFLNALNSAILIVSISLTAEAQEHVLPDAARDVLVRYSSALNRGDCEAMLELASPEIISRLHRFEGGKDGFCEGIRYFHDIGIVDSLGEPLAIKSEGPYRMAMVETIRLLVVPLDSWTREEFMYCTLLIAGSIGGCWITAALTMNG